MNIQLKPEQEKFIQEQMATGKYQNPQEIIDIAFIVLQKLNTGEAISQDIQIYRNKKNHNNFLEAANKAYENLRKNPKAWQEELEERELWEQTDF